MSHSAPPSTPPPAPAPAAIAAFPSPGSSFPSTTPPRFSYNSTDSGPINLPFTTPPRTSRKRSFSHSLFDNKRPKSSPSSRPSTVIHNLPSTPEATPHKSPRSIRKKPKDIILTPPSSSSYPAHNNPYITPKPPSSMFSFGMFLPTPSTVGSGRKVKQHQKAQKQSPQNIHQQTETDTSSSLHLIQPSHTDTSSSRTAHRDSQSNDNDHPIISKPKRSIAETLRALAGSNDNDSINNLHPTHTLQPDEINASSISSSPAAHESITPPQSTIKSSIGNKSIPTTPPNNIINDDMVKQWHAKSLAGDDPLHRKSVYIDVNDEREIEEILNISRRQRTQGIKPNIPNPFLDGGDDASDTKAAKKPLLNSLKDLKDSKDVPSGSTSPSAFHQNMSSSLSNPFGITFKDKVDLSSQAEFINHKTGERVVRDLSAREKNIRPKKLSFTLSDDDHHHNHDHSDIGYSLASASRPEGPRSPSPSPVSAPTTAKKVNMKTKSTPSLVSTTHLPGTTPRPKPAFANSPFTSPAATTTPTNTASRPIGSTSSTPSRSSNVRNPFTTSSVTWPSSLSAPTSTSTTPSSSLSLLQSHLQPSTSSSSSTSASASRSQPVHQLHSNHTTQTTHTSPFNNNERKVRVNQNIQNKHPYRQQNKAGSNGVMGAFEQSIGKRFMLKNLSDFMVDGKPKNSLGFEIFKDEEGGE